MKTYIANFWRLLLIVSLVSLLNACGLDIGVDDEDLEKAEEILDEMDDDDDEDDQDKAEDEDGNDIAGPTDDDDDSDSDTSGGVQIVDESDDYYEFIGPRVFLGSFSKLQKSAYYYDNNSYIPCKYSFPTNMRVYSHEDVLDFENTSQELLFIAETAIDESFSFDAVFLNSLGQPTLETSCLCYLEEPYYDYENEQIECVCEVEQRDDCKISWERIN